MLSLLIELDFSQGDSSRLESSHMLILTLAGPLDKSFLRLPRYSFSLSLLHSQGLTLVLRVYIVSEDGGALS